MYKTTYTMMIKLTQQDMDIELKLLFLIQKIDLLPNSQIRLYDEEVIEAARYGRRVKLTIIDFKNFHSSDSIRMKYEMIE